MFFIFVCCICCSGWVCFGGVCIGGILFGGGFGESVVVCCSWGSLVYGCSVGSVVVLSICVGG